LREVSDEQFRIDWNENPSPTYLAQKYGIDVRNIHAWRRQVEAKFNIELKAGERKPRPKIPVPKIGARALFDVKDGEVLIGSDGHFWPGERSFAFDAFIKLIAQRKPSLIVFNGDALDGSKISRHAPGGFANLPDLADELAAVQERMSEVEQVAPKECPLVICAGNHDTRFSARLAQMAPEFVRVKGTDLADHLPAWNFAWTCFINDTVVVQHYWHGGVHAAYNNALKSGKTIVTGHTHRLQTVQFADYNGLRYGIECGMLQEIDPNSDKLHWTRDTPLNWSAGFVHLEFIDGVLQEPTLCRVINGRVRFRGEYI
jgi:predicted phosphodiesterase